jgi:hypothetical protein
VIAAARGWLGTPYHDQASLKGVGCDCLGLARGVLAQGEMACAWIAGDVSRDADGLLTVPVILPHGPDAPAARRFPAPLLVTADGPVALPPFDAPPEAAPEP